MRSKKKAAWNAPRWACALAAFIGLGLSAQATVQREASEYNLAPALAGDQMHSDLALGPTGGYLVWDDNVGDGDGLAVNLRRINSTLSGQQNVISLATRTANNQERPRVAILKGGGAAFVWQGGADSAQQVFLRVMNSADQFVAEEVAVSARTDVDQQNASVAVLANGNIVVVWDAFGTDGDEMQGVYGALFNAAGQKIGAEFRVNQFTAFNQRSATVTALPGGGFAVGWISEGQRSEISVDLYARLYSSTGAPVAGEFRVNNSDNVCSSPSVAATAAGNFTFAWCESLQDSPTNGLVIPVRSNVGWDVYVSSFTSAGSRLANPKVLNERTVGNQKNPSIATVGNAQMVVWSSFGQDGDRDAIVGRSLTSVGAPEATEFVVNSTTFGRQVQPVVRGNDDGRFVVSWSMFTGVAENFEIRAQRYTAEPGAAALMPPPAPFVSALTMTRLSVAWPAVAGYDVASYELYVDGSATAVPVNGLVQVVSVPASSTHTFSVAYRLRDGQLSPRSAEATGKAWGADGNADRLPDDWQAQYYGPNPAAWAKPGDDTDHDGASTEEEFYAGTNPTLGSSVLRTEVLDTPQGWRLSWNTTAGQVYQVQQTTDFETWTDSGGQRFAAGANDSVSVPFASALGYYRVIRIR